MDERLKRAVAKEVLVISMLALVALAVAVTVGASFSGAFDSGRPLSLFRVPPGVALLYGIGWFPTIFLALLWLRAVAWAIATLRRSSG